MQECLCYCVIFAYRLHTFNQEFEGVGIAGLLAVHGLVDKYRRCAVQRQGYKGAPPLVMREHYTLPGRRGGGWQAGGVLT